MTMIAVFLFIICIWLWGWVGLAAFLAIMAAFVGLWAASFGVSWVFDRPVVQRAGDFVYANIIPLVAGMYALMAILVFLWP